MRCLAAIDSDASAIDTFARNHPAVPHALARDLTRFGPKDLEELLGSERIDVVVGGPPCQGFSMARQVDGANHGGRLVKDPRRDLYKEFLRFVDHYRPAVFAMENVLGIKSAAGGAFFTQVQVESRNIGYRVIPFQVEAWRFGVPQKRVRQLIIGTRVDLPLFVPGQLIRPTHALPEEDGAGELEPAVTLGEAIGDLPAIAAGDEQSERRYDLRRRGAHLARYGRRYVCNLLQAHRAPSLTGHAARPHSARDLRDFRRLREGETSGEAIRRGVNMEFPYSRDSFKDRFTRQHRDRLCSTIVAHLKKDGLMFIHPTQARSLTPREAARVQSFPDTFVFPAARTNAFAQIGNAVPPLIGRAVGDGIVQYLSAVEPCVDARPNPAVLLPESRELAIQKLEGLVESLYLQQISQLPRSDFLEAWWAVGFLHPHLHPDAALENGSAISRGTRRAVSYVVEPVYLRSGWPVELVPIALEARRRFDANLLAAEEYYCSVAVMAGAASSQFATHNSRQSARKVG